MPQALLWHLPTEDPISDGCRPALSHPGPLLDRGNTHTFLTPLWAGDGSHPRHNPTSHCSCRGPLVLLPQTEAGSSPQPPTVCRTPTSLIEAIQWTTAGRRWVNKDKGTTSTEGTPGEHHLDPRMPALSLILAGNKIPQTFIICNQELPISHPLNEFLREVKFGINKRIKMCTARVGEGFLMSSLLQSQHTLSCQLMRCIHPLALIM